MSTIRSAIVLSLVVAPAPAFAAFPGDAAFVPLRCHDRAPMTDAAQDDAPNLDERDVVGTAGAPAGLRAADDTNLYLRLRLDRDPAPGGTVTPHAWGMEFDLDGDLRTYELLILADGTAGGVGTVSVFTNKTTTTLDDPTDPADLPAAATYSFANNARTVAAATTTDGNADAFLDLAVPWTALAPLGLGRDTPTYVWVASSNAAARLNGDFACFDERTGAPTASGVASDPTTGDPANDPATGGGGGGERLEGGGGCAAGGGGGPAMLLVIAAAVFARRRARGPSTPGSLALAPRFLRLRARLRSPLASFDCGLACARPSLPSTAGSLALAPRFLRLRARLRSPLAQDERKAEADDHVRLADRHCR